MEQSLRGGFGNGRQALRYRGREIYMEGKEELVKMRAFKGQRQGVSIEHCLLFWGVMPVTEKGPENGD